MRFRALALAAATFVAVPAAALAQAPPTVRGNLRGNVVSVRTASDAPAFDFVVTGAALVGGKLELRGTVRSAGGAAGTPATASLVGTLAKDPSPDYAAGRAKRAAAQRQTDRAPASGSAEDQKPGGAATTTEASGQIGQLAQATQSTARDTEPPATTDAAAEAKDAPPPSASPTDTSGCDMLFLRLAVPSAFSAAVGGKTVQVNVALARLDNAAGVDVSRRICRVVVALAAGDAAVAQRVAELDRALAGAK